MNLRFFLLCSLCLTAPVMAAEAPIPKPDSALDKAAFGQAAAGVWQEVFSDPCTGDWRQQWFLDGDVGTVTNGPDGMTLTAGPEFKNEAHHLVLWTKQSFEGNLKIEFDYTRTDKETRCVNILYIQATGSGKGPYASDISQWNELRKVPAMDIYFDHMHAYHLSYAAFPNSGENRVSYLRARRYLPEGDGLKGTELAPDYDPQGFFAEGVKHHITVIKKDRDLFLRVENPDRVGHYHFRNPRLPAITNGRVGLRHMFTRSARYRSFQISIPRKQTEEEPNRKPTTHNHHETNQTADPPAVSRDSRTAAPGCREAGSSTLRWILTIPRTTGVDDLTRAALGLAARVLPFREICFRNRERNH